MASWHQSKNPAALASLWTPEPGKFKCISDKAGQPASCMTFNNRPDAERYCQNTGDVLIAPLLDEAPAQA